MSNYSFQGAKPKYMYMCKVNSKYTSNNLVHEQDSPVVEGRVSKESLARG